MGVYLLKKKIIYNNFLIAKTTMLINDEIKKENIVRKEQLPELLMTYV